MSSKKDIRNILLEQLNEVWQQIERAPSQETANQLRRHAELLMNHLQQVEAKGWDMTKKSPKPEPPKIYRNLRREAILAQRERNGQQSV